MQNFHEQIIYYTKIVYIIYYLKKLHNILNIATKFKLHQLVRYACHQLYASQQTLRRNESSAGIPRLELAPQPTCSKPVPFIILSSSKLIDTSTRQIKRERKSIYFRACNTCSQNREWQANTSPWRRESSRNPAAPGLNRFQVSSSASKSFKRNSNEPQKNGDLSSDTHKG